MSVVGLQRGRKILRLVSLFKWKKSIVEGVGFDKACQAWSKHPKPRLHRRREDYSDERNEIGLDLESR